MFGIGSTELLVILVVALVVLGPKSLPGIAKTVGKVMGEFRRVSTEFQRTMNAEVANDEHEKRKKEAEEELFGKEEKSASADASTAKQSQASTAPNEEPVVDTVATACTEKTQQDSPLAKAVAKAEEEAQNVAPQSSSASTAPVKEKELA